MGKVGIKPFAPSAREVHHARSLRITKEKELQLLHARVVHLSRQCERTRMAIADTRCRETQVRTQRAEARAEKRIMCAAVREESDSKGSKLELAQRRSNNKRAVAAHMLEILETRHAAYVAAKQAEAAQQEEVRREREDWRASQRQRVEHMRLQREAPPDPISQKIVSAAGAQTARNENSIGLGRPPRAQTARSGNSIGFGRPPRAPHTSRC